MNELLWCSNSFFRKWIVYQLYGTMILDNYGKIWYLDHSYPIPKTNLSDENDLYKSTNWTNLRPMNIKDNHIKGNKIDMRLYLLQEIKSKCFMELNAQEG